MDRRIVFIVVGVILVLLLMRIPVLARFMVYIAALALLGLLVYGLVQWWRLRRVRRAEEAFRRTREGRLVETVEECDLLMDRNRHEMEEIQRSIDDLREKVKLPGITDKQREESEGILQAFASELDLRRTKAVFFERCREKLRALRQHILLERELENKKDFLRRLRENNFEDLAQYEGIKSELELNTYYLETIDELSSRMIASTSVDDARHLQLELEEMTRELDR